MPDRHQKEIGPPFVEDKHGLALAINRDGKLYPVGKNTLCRIGEQVLFLIFAPDREKVQQHLHETGWQQISSINGDEFTTSQCMIDV